MLGLVGVGRHVHVIIVAKLKSFARPEGLAGDVKTLHDYDLDELSLPRRQRRKGSVSFPTATLSGSFVMTLYVRLYHPAQVEPGLFRECRDKFLTVSAL